MSQPQILIIADDPIVARSLQAGLSHEGFAVVWRSTGVDGMKYEQKAAPHLVLLAIRLPDGSGFDFCRQMREMGLRQPVIEKELKQRNALVGKPNESDAQDSC